MTFTVPDTSSPAWRLRRTNGRNVLVLGGDWIAQSGHIPEFPDRDLLDSKHGGALAFDTADLGRWDSGLIAFLWDVKRAAAVAGLALDGSTLPESARKLLGLLPTAIGEPGLSRRRGFRPFYWLGGKTLGMFEDIGELSELLAATVKGGLRAVVAKAMIRGVDLFANVRAAGPSALIIVSVVNFLIGAILAFVGAVQLRRFAADIFVANPGGPRFGA